ncbi:MAG: TldD/PmbA family protein [Candidatus Micrarchaeota archaeon]
MFGLEKYQYAELRFEETESLRLALRDETNLAAGTSYGVSARVLKNGAWGFAASNSKNADAGKLLENAEKLAGLQTGKIKVANTTAEKKKTADSIKWLDDEAVLAMVKEAEKETNSKNKLSANLGFSGTKNSWQFYNSEGRELDDTTAHFYFSCSVIAREGSLMQTGLQSAGSRIAADKIDMRHVAMDAMEMAERLLHADAPPKGKFQAVLDPEMNGTFIHEVVGHASEADAIITKESVYAGQLGKKVGNELVTIYDDPTLPYFGHYRYDDEGVEGKRASLITNGVLTGLMNSRESAAELNQQLNGHARADSYDSQPIVRMSNTMFKPGKSKLDEVFDIKHGVYIKGSLGGSVDIFSGGFMFKAKEGNLIENGQLGKTLRDVAIIGDLKEVLNGITAVGNDFATHPGICGKSGQRAPVEDGGPHIRVNSITIG